MNKAWVVIPAAGVGKRMQSNTPKQYLKLHGKTVIEHTLGCFTKHSDIAGIVVALHPDDPYWAELTIDSEIPIHAVEGGKERADSVLNALIFLLDIIDSKKDFVLVHDAARPCLSTQDLDQLLTHRQQLANSENGTGAILAVPVRDTMKRGNGNNQIDHTVERDNLWHALTPQMFPVDQLHHALAKGLAEGAEITDEASAIELEGGSPELIEGAASNIKITRPEDLQLAEFFLQQEVLS
jgi:2-C-methyl-D-erythritol 4-phosphate cytidylyltransferase